MPVAPRSLPLLPPTEGENMFFPNVPYEEHKLKRHNRGKSSHSPVFFAVTSGMWAYTQMSSCVPHYVFLCAAPNDDLASHLSGNFRQRQRDHRGSHWSDRRQQGVYGRHSPNSNRGNRSGDVRRERREARYSTDGGSRRSDLSSGDTGDRKQKAHDDGDEEEDFSNLLHAHQRKRNKSGM